MLIFQYIKTKWTKRASKMYVILKYKAQSGNDYSPFSMYGLVVKPYYLEFGINPVDLNLYSTGHKHAC